MPPRIPLSRERVLRAAVALADAQGIETAMWVIAAIPVPALLLALTLPGERRLGLKTQVPKTRSPASPSPGRM